MKFSALFLSITILTFLSASPCCFAKSQKKAPKPKPKETPTTRQLYGEQGRFQGGHTIASLPRLAGQ